ERQAAKVGTANAQEFSARWGTVRTFDSSLDAEHCGTFAARCCVVSDAEVLFLTLGFPAFSIRNQLAARQTDLQLSPPFGG
ncbi:MAG TPA: hypothetical protein DCY79_21680, partial [Planctomycetaceae bacterium]|nr:hypothetical protein [Planctomycetaceae bacterium]